MPRTRGSLPPYCDVWPALRPDEDGFTEDTSINLMRYDMKDKQRQVRFDRVLLKGRHWRATRSSYWVQSRSRLSFPVCFRPITSGGMPPQTPNP